MAHSWWQCMKSIFGMNNGNGQRSLHPAVRKRPLVTERLDNRTRKLTPLLTIRLSPESLAGDLQRTAGGRSGPAKTAEQVRLEWYGMTDVGSVRDHNEDSFFCTGIEDTGLFIVADGMGGHDGGEVASRLAVETVCNELRETAKREKDPIALIEKAVIAANKAVIREGNSKGSNMGTTLGVALLSEGGAYIANVGDSRAYWIKNGSISQVTEDHSLVAKLVAAGKITKEEARTHPKSNLLYRTIGSDENVKVDTYHLDLEKGGALLLCSDGLWGEVRDEDIHRACMAEKDLKAVCGRLVKMANDSGGKDNITVVAVRIM